MEINYLKDETNIVFSDVGMGCLFCQTNTWYVRCEGSGADSKYNAVQLNDGGIYSFRDDESIDAIAKEIDIKD